MFLNGKVARLPAPIRKELKLRLADGWAQTKVANWLNELPETREVVNRDFKGVPISRRNVSTWIRSHSVIFLTKAERAEQIKALTAAAWRLVLDEETAIAEGALAISCGKILELLEATEDSMEPEELHDIISSLVRMRSAELAKQRAQTDSERLKRKDEEIALAHKRFEQKLKEYSDKVNAQKNEIESALMMTEDGGLTPEALRRIEEAANLL